MGHYTNFYKKLFSLLMTIYVGLIHTSRALLVSIIFIIEDYYLSEIEDMMFSALTIPKKNVQKVSRKRLKTKVHIPYL